MKGSKIVSLLKTLNKKEFKEFGNFVNSPNFTRKKKLLEFYKVICLYYPDFDKPKFNQHTIFKKLYPGKTYNEKIINYLKTELYKAAETYIGIIDMRKNIFDFHLHILKQLGKRQLHSEFGRKAAKLKSIINKNKIRNDNYYLMSYLLKKETRNFYETKKPLGKRIEYFKDMNDELDEFIVFFIVKMLKYYTILRNQENLLNYSYSYKLQDELMAFAKENLIKSHPAANIFYLLNLLYKNTENDSVFYELKNFVETNIGLLEKEDAELIYTELFNYSKIKYVGGNDSYGPENTSIMKFMIARDIYPKENNYMSENTFINIVSNSLRERDYEWIENFIDKFSNKITPDRKANAYNYSLGMLYYWKKKYNTALEYLAKVKTDDFYYYLRVNNHLLKIYYETNEIVGILNTIDATKHFLSSNKVIPGYVKDRFLHFIIYLQKVVRAIETGDNNKLKKLAEEISSAPEFENKIWLLKRIEEKLTD
ncbi:MAG: hypothetical protein EHM58_17495 [Ignavibacteriae bacterium]|nr:MAG: hypothetical protein EHM58_17495 [Ignavibacteriota bacterium]